MTSRWYVVQTQPHAESKAVEHLARQGFGAYLPRYLKRRRHARKVELIAADKKLKGLQKRARQLLVAS